MFSFKIVITLLIEFKSAFICKFLQVEIKSFYVSVFHTNRVRKLCEKLSIKKNQVINQLKLKFYLSFFNKFILN